MNDTDERLAKLPTWARDHIKRLQYASEPMQEECVRLRRENGRLAERAKAASASNEALLEILRKAASAGSEVASAIVKTLEGYEIYMGPHTLQANRANDCE